jgi:hypothetical protein
MARGMVGPSEKERELADHVGKKYSMERRTEGKRVMAGAVGVIITVCIVAIVIGVAYQSAVPEQYTVMWFGPPDLYLGILNLTTAGEDFIKEAEFVLHLEIPGWRINEVRQMSYTERMVEGKRLDYLSGVPMNGQVTEKTSRKEVDFTLWLEIGTPNAEVAGLKLLGGTNRIEGTLCNHPDKDLVELSDSGPDVDLDDHKTIEIDNRPTLAGVNAWTIAFSKTQFT